MRNHLRPLFDRVVVKELEPDRIRQSGLLVPAGTHEPPPQHGIVLAVGPGLDWWEHVGVQMPVKPGDHVVFPASAGAWVEVDEERLLVCRVGELLGVLETVRHQLRPLFDRVVVKELDQDRVRRSGLVVPPGSHDPPPQQGIVLAVGPGLDWWEQAGVEMPVEPGDHVVFPASAGAWVEVDEERLLVCRVGELLGVLESA